MNKNEILKKLNKKIDALILGGKKNSPQYKELCKQHKKILLAG